MNLIKPLLCTNNALYLLGQQISGGKLSLQVLFLGITVHSESHDICEKSSCPISAGKFVLSHTQKLPGITPSVSQNC